MRKTSEKSLKKGFTLVELIVVIAIISILTAVIVPLVGRYSAQATYAGLQDTAKSISNSTSYAIADVTKMGVICETDYFTGHKENNSLTVSSFIFDSGGNAVQNSSVTGSTNVDMSSLSQNEDLVCGKMIELLFNALPQSCYFRVEVEKNAIISVVYSADQDVTGVASSDNSVVQDTDFEGAYTYNDKAVGVYGSYKA